MKTPGQLIHVILTDDDEDDRELFQEALSQLEIKTKLTCFRDCASMFKMLDNPKKSDPAPDIIFLDINMPGKSGIEGLSEIRQNARYSNVLVIMFTTSTRQVDIQESRKFGANLYINKPNGFTELVETLRKLFSPKWYESLIKSTQSIKPLPSSFINKSK